MKIKFGTNLAALLRKNLQESKQEDAAYQLNKLDMLEVTIQYIHTCCQSIPYSNTKQHFALLVLFTLQHCVFHPQEDRACIY